MDRLTKRIGNLDAVPSCFDLDFVFDLDDKTYKGLVAVFNRLCDYEDTDLLPDEVNNIKPRNRLLFSKRKKLAQEFEKWAEEFNAKNCPESVIAYLYQNGFLATNRILNYLKLIEEEENERKIDV